MSPNRGRPQNFKVDLLKTTLSALKPFLEKTVFSEKGFNAILTKNILLIGLDIKDGSIPMYFYRWRRST